MKMYPADFQRGPGIDESRQTARATTVGIGASWFTRTELLLAGIYGAGLFFVTIRTLSKVRCDFCHVSIVHTIGLVVNRKAN